MCVNLWRIQVRTDSASALSNITEIAQDNAKDTDCWFAITSYHRRRRGTTI